MLKWLKRIWNDPVGSEVIAGGILALLAAAGGVVWHVKKESNITIVRNQGTIDRAKIDDTTVKGTPPPGSNFTLFQNDPNGRMGDLSLSHTNLDFRATGPIPAPSPAEMTADDPVLSYRKRVNKLIDAMSLWKQTNQIEFEKAFGKQILLLASQLRKCDFREMPNFYGRNKWPPKIPIDQLVLLDTQDLISISAHLPDDDSKLTCADSGRGPVK